MNAKQIGTRVDELAKELLREGGLFEEGKLTQEEKIKLIDVVGSSLIMTGTSLMCEAGAPSDVVLSRAVSILSKYKQQMVAEAQEAAAAEETPRILLA